MRQVTKQEFFAAINPRDVHPRVDTTTLKGRYHTSSFETPARVLVGRLVSDSWAVDPSQFFLVEEPRP